VKGFWKALIIAAIVVVVGILVVGAVAFAQDTEDGAEWPFNLRERMHEAVASILGVSPEAYEGAIDTARDQVLDEAVSEGLLTQEQAERMQERVEQGFGPGMMGGSFGSRGGRHGAWGGGGFTGGSENSLMVVAAEELGLTTQELWDQLQDGSSIADVANAQGVDPQTIADEFVSQRAEILSQAVAEGRITQERADWMLEHLEEEDVMEHLTEPFPMGAKGPGGYWRGTQDGFQGGSRMRPGGRFPAVTGQDDA
jgi:hypothetical protein